MYNVHERWWCSMVILKSHFKQIHCISFDILHFYLFTRISRIFPFIVFYFVFIFAIKCLRNRRRLQNEKQIFNNVWCQCPNKFENEIISTSIRFRMKENGRKWTVSGAHTLFSDFSSTTCKRAKRICFLCVLYLLIYLMDLFSLLLATATDKKTPSKSNSADLQLLSYVLCILFAFQRAQQRHNINTRISLSALFLCLRFFSPRSSLNVVVFHGACWYLFQCKPSVFAAAIPSSLKPILE